MGWAPPPQSDCSSGPSHGPLACQSCQRKKTKCDRLTPCGQCTKSGLECVPSTRKPRTQGKKRVTRDEGLRKRITKLENLFASLNSNPDASVQRKDSSAWKYMGSPFWISLVTEAQALRDALDEDLSEDQDSSPSPSYNRVEYDWLICSPRSVHLMPCALPEPTVQLSATLFGVFCRNFNPLFRTFHNPTLEDFMIRSFPYLGRSHHAQCNKMLKAVIWFAATNTLSEIECDRVFGKSKSSQIQLFRRLVDVSLVQADLLNSNDIATLQALLTYIVSPKIER